MSEEKKAQRTIVGRVVSDKMDKSVSVAIESLNCAVFIASILADHWAEIVFLRQHYATTRPLLRGTSSLPRAGT